MVSWQGKTMGSVYTVKIVDAPLPDQELEAIKAEVDVRLKEINRQMSHYQTNSELSGFFRTPANVPFKVSPEFARVLRFSLDLNRRSRGAFDPTLGPLINLWGFGEQSSQLAVPPEDKLRAALQQTGCRHLTVTKDDELIKDRPDIHINLGGIAKGYGVDEMVRILRKHTLTNFYASIAGEVFVAGHNALGTNWQVGISAPVSNWRDSDPLAGVLSISETAVSTSGDYQKFFLDPQGRRLCHIFDPRTGWPVQHNVGGVTVVAGDNMTADALATTLFVLGLEDGLRLVESWTNAAALFVIRQPDGTFQTVPSSRFSSRTGCRTEVSAR
jgi:thiamine biosynthesis lipoprotein